MRKIDQGKVLATVLKLVMVEAPKLVVTKEAKVVALGELDGAQTPILTGWVQIALYSDHEQGIC